MSTVLSAAEAFPPGEYLRDELDARGWTVTEFAEIIGRPIQAVSEILNGKKEITTETALAIAEALGTTPELWLNLQTNHRLLEQRSKEDHGARLTPVARRAPPQPRAAREGAQPRMPPAVDGRDAEHGVWCVTDDACLHATGLHDADAVGDR